MKENNNEFLFVLKSSKIPKAGLGVFAVQNAPADSRIGLFLGEYSDEEVNADEIPGELQGYCVNKGGGKLLCPKDFSLMNLGNYINHSSTPNVSYDEHNGYITLRDVQKGEELFVDYNAIGDLYEVPIEERESHVRRKENCKENVSTRLPPER